MYSDYLNFNGQEELTLEIVIYGHKFSQFFESPDTSPKKIVVSEWKEINGEFQWKEIGVFADEHQAFKFFNLTANPQRNNQTQKLFDYVIQ